MSRGCMRADAAGVEEARLRFAWALAHSEADADVHRALEMLSTWMESKEVQRQREPLYLLGVAEYRLGHLAEAKRWAEEALSVAPTCQQAATLRTACEDQLAEDALIAGLGVAGLVGGLAAVAFALMASGRRRA
jgi:hypothetical protein